MTIERRRLCCTADGDDWHVLASRVVLNTQLLDPSADPDVHGLIRRTAYSSIDIIPASAAVGRFDLSDQRSWEQADLHRSFVDPIRELRGRYDLIVFDCPPRLSLVSFAALCASDFVIVPLEAADWGAQGIMMVTAAIDYVAGRFNRQLRLLGYLVSRFKRSRAYQQSYLAQCGAQLYVTEIPRRNLAQSGRIEPRPVFRPLPRLGKFTLSNPALFFGRAVSRRMKKEERDPFGR